METNRFRIANPTAGDLAYFDLLRRTELTQIQADEAEAAREAEEHRRDMELRAKFQRRVRLTPGNAGAMAAFKEGLEDDYINGMSAKYGGEW